MTPNELIRELSKLPDDAKDAEMYAASSHGGLRLYSYDIFGLDTIPAEELGDDDLDAEFDGHEIVVLQINS